MLSNLPRKARKAKHLKKYLEATFEGSKVQEIVYAYEIQKLIKLINQNVLLYKAILELENNEQPKVPSANYFITFLNCISIENKLLLEEKC